MPIRELRIPVDEGHLERVDAMAFDRNLFRSAELLLALESYLERYTTRSPARQLEDVCGSDPAIDDLDSSFVKVAFRDFTWPRADE